MARRRRATSPSPPPPQQSSSGEEEEEGSPRAAAVQMPPQAQDPQPHTPVAAAEDAGNGKESHPDAEAHPFHSPMHSPAKPAAAADQLESDADEEELEVVPKKAATTSKSKAEVHEKKRPAPEPAAPSGKAKKAKAEASKGKKMGITKMEKVVPQPTLSRKGDKPTGGNPAEKSGLSSSGLTKSEARRPWSKKDSIMILEALAAHVKSDTALMKTADLLALVRDRLDRKNCEYDEMYEKVRSLKNRYDKISSTGNVPSGEDQLRMYHLSDEIWGEKAKEAIAAAASQKDSSLTKSKRGQATKEKVDGNSKGETVKEATNQNIDTQRGNEKDQAVVVETDRNVKRKLSREDTATATQNGDTLVNGKGGKTENDASTGNQNGGVGTTEETDEENAEREVISVRGTPRRFDELQNLYPGLAECVEGIKAQHPCGETLRTAFGFIDDEMANALESNIKEQRIVKAKIQIDQWDIKMEVLGMLIHLEEQDF